MPVFIYIFFDTIWNTRWTQTKIITGLWLYIAYRKPDVDLNEIKKTVSVENQSEYTQIKSRAWIKPICVQSLFLNGQENIENNKSKRMTFTCPVMAEEDGKIWNH